MSDEAGIDFEWTLADVGETYLQVKCDFSKPLSVSQGAELDKVHLEIPIFIQQDNAVSESIVFFYRTG